jgi:hypothetical protein
LPPAGRHPTAPCHPPLTPHPPLPAQVFGITPFRGARRDETFENIIKAPLRFPQKPLVSEACMDLITQLLTKDPAKRLGTKKGEGGGGRRGAAWTSSRLGGAWACTGCVRGWSMLGRGGNGKRGVGGRCNGRGWAAPRLQFPLPLTTQ